MNPKLKYKPGDVTGNIDAAITAGWKYGMILKTVDDWATILRVMPKPGEFDKDALAYFRCAPKTAQGWRNELVSELAGQMDNAIAKHDGTFFHRLADCIEEREQLPDENRLWLLATCFDWETRKQKAFFTSGQLVQMAAKHRRWIVSPRRMETICSQLGIKRRKAPEGRR
jgi:hypothetical protein